MFPFWNVFVVNQVCDLSEQHSNILWVCQPVLSTSPHRSWYSHLFYFVERGSRLRRRKVKRKALERTSLQCNTTLQSNILANARRMCRILIFSSSLEQLEMEMESWLNRKYKPCNIIVLIAVKVWFKEFTRQRGSRSLRECIPLELLLNTNQTLKVIATLKVWYCDISQSLKWQGAKYF